MAMKRKVLAGAAAVLAVGGAGAGVAATKLTTNSPSEESKAIVNDAAKSLGVEPSKLSAALKKAFEDHLRQTENHLQRLDQVFQKLGQSPTAKFCKGMDGLLKEGQEMMKEKADPDVLDAALISAAQRVEHYEIAAYGTVRTYANELGDSDIQRLLQQTLDEEGDTDKKLTRIAESKVNEQAMKAA